MATSTSPETHLTVRQAAAQVPCAPKRVYTAIQNRELRAIRLSSKMIRIRQTDFNAWLASQETTQPRPAAERAKLLSPEDIAFLSELAAAAPKLSEEQKDTIRAAFKDGGRRAAP